MAMLSKVARLFQIKTRFEAWLVIYAIALGAVEQKAHSADRRPMIQWVRPQPGQ